MRKIKGNERRKGLCSQKVKKFGTGVWGGKVSEGEERVLFKRSAQRKYALAGRDVAARSRVPKRLFFLIVVFDFSSAAAGDKYLARRAVGESTSGRRPSADKWGRGSAAASASQGGLPAAAAPIYSPLRLDRRPKTHRAAGSPRSSLELVRRLDGDWNFIMRAKPASLKLHTVHT